MTDSPLAYFITWTCYGTYLPGDDRGWTKWQEGDQLSNPELEDWCQSQLGEKPVLLDEWQRRIVNDVVRAHCEIRGWHLHAVNCRTNHCHVVVMATNVDGGQVRSQLKSWAKRRLKEHQQEHGQTNAEVRERWWTRNGSVRHLHDEESLEAAVLYTLDGQELGGSKVELREK